MRKQVFYFVLFLIFSGAILGWSEEKTELPPGLAGVADEEVFFPVWDNLKAGQWVTYTQSVAGRGWDLEYTLKVLEIKSNDYYLLQATTVRPYETIVKKWKVSLKNGKILEYWLAALGRAPQKFPVLTGANNTELINIEKPLVNKTADGKKRLFDLKTPAGNLKCWLVSESAPGATAATSYLSEKVPLYQVVKQTREGVSVQLKAFGVDTTVN